jgi:hypothetical protein
VTSSQLLDTLTDLAANDPSDEVRETAAEAVRTYQNKLDLLAVVGEGWVVGGA